MADTYKASIVQELAKATGVQEDSVKKVLDELGLPRILPDAVRGNDGKQPTLQQAKLAFKIGKSTIIC